MLLILSDSLATVYTFIEHKYIKYKIMLMSQNESTS